MALIPSKKILKAFLPIVLVLAIVLIDPKGEVFSSFDKNYAKSYYFEQCEKMIDHPARRGGYSLRGESVTLEKEGTPTSTPLHVVEVTDGDTILVSKNCEPVTVRMIGINTPETVDPRRPVECFGKEASNKAKELLAGKDVIIETDPSQDEYDKYGRLLGYVILPDGTNFNQEMIEEGYAYEYTYKIPYRYQKEFKAAQLSAQENKKGLWAEESCNGIK